MINDLPECVLRMIILAALTKKTLQMAKDRHNKEWPTLQSFCAEGWLDTTGNVSKSWRDHVQPLWKDLCRKEFPWEAEPCRDAYIRWRRLHSDTCGPLRPRQPTADTMHKSDRVPSILLVARLALNEDTTEVVWHTTRPFMNPDSQDLDLMEGTAMGPNICYPLEPKYNWHNGMGGHEYVLPFRFPLPSKNKILEHAKEFGFTLQRPVMDGADVMVFDTFIQDTSGKVAHFECFNQFPDDMLFRGNTEEGLTTDFETLPLFTPVDDTVR